MGEGQELEWLRFEIDQLVAARLLAPLGEVDRARYRELVARERELIGIPRATRSESDGGRAGPGEAI